MTSLRDYQQRAKRSVYDAWRAGARGVLLVSPTGSGKTMMGTSIVRDAVAKGHHVTWVAHRGELVAQAEQTLHDVYGVSAGVHVETVQTLLSRGLDTATRGQLVVLDEGHHYGAAEWSAVTQLPGRILGLTATPERSDGKPLNAYDEMVVAAQYSELLEAGHLVSCRVFRPQEALLSGVAQDPVRAYEAHGENGQGFVFAPSVEVAHEWADQFCQAGHRAAVIEQNTTPRLRAAYLQAFRDKKLKLLINVFVLTEGVDVPAAQVCLLGRGVGHVSPYLQMVGRVLRPQEGKPYGILIDLPGASFQHGLPTEDREYSLTRGIERAKGEAGLRVCIRCGMTFVSVSKCPSCGYCPPPTVTRPTIYDLALQEVYEGEQTTQLAKDRELERLLREAQARSWSIGFVVREYTKLFGGKPDLSTVPVDVKRREYDALKRAAQERRYNDGWVSHRFRAAFGHWPARSWG